MKAPYLTFYGSLFRYNDFKGTKDKIVITLEPLCFLIRFGALFSLPVVRNFITGILLGTLELVIPAHAHEFPWSPNSTFGMSVSLAFPVIIYIYIYFALYSFLP
jgi:hypothetical protein